MADKACNQVIKVDDFIEKAKQWQSEITALRRLLLTCELTESFKWGKPCYTYENNNVVIIQPFKDYCALLFFKGMLIDDQESLLVKTGVNTHVGRQVRFRSVSEINKDSEGIKRLISKAITLEKKGEKIPKNKIPITMTEELIAVFREDKLYEKAFEALTPGRKRGYIYHFSSPKQRITKMTRIAKARHDILEGIGLNERKKPM